MCSIPATAERAVARSHFSIRQNPHAQLTGKLFLCSGGLRCFWSARNNSLWVILDAAKIGRLRASGASWATICDETVLSKGTAQRAFYSLPQNDFQHIF